MGWKVLTSASFSSKARGVITLTRNNYEVIIHSSKIDPQGRYAIVDATIDHTRIILCNVYAPNIYDKEFFLNILALLYQYGDKPLIWGGGL